MYRAIFRKGLEALVTLFCATLVIFLLTRLAPGDPIKLLFTQSSEIAASNTQAFEKKTAELRAQWSLDRPMIVQYGMWIGGLLSFDLGTSIHTGIPVGSELAARLPATIALAASALLIQAVLGVLLGTVSARKTGTSIDAVIRVVCIAFASTPAFVIGLVLLSLFAVTLGVYEISSEASLSRLWLPAITLGLIGAPPFIRVVRANLLSELGQLYVLSALSRGLGRKRAAGHAVRNALPAAVTMAGLSFTTLIGGAVVIESIFSWPGIGKYAFDNILLKNYPAIQGYALVTVMVVVFVHLLVDVLYTLVDPRIHSKGESEVEEAA